MKKLIKRLFGGLLNLFKSSENPLLKDPDYSGQKISSRGNYTKMGPLEPDRVVAPLYYGPYNLPGVNVTALNLKKAQPFPYGQINVEANNGKTLAYPSGNNPLQEAVFRNKAKRQIAGNRGLLLLNGGSFNGLPLSFILQFQLNQTNPLTGKKPEVKGWEINDGQFDVLTAQGGDKLPTAQNAAERYKGGQRHTNSFKNFGDSVTVRGVEGISPWYKKSPVILEQVRHSKLGPEYNDTTYAERPAYFPLLLGQVRAASNSKYLGKRNSSWFNLASMFLNNSEETPESAANYNALQRRFNTAWGVAKHQQGGEVKSDNTRVTLIPNNGEAIYEKTSLGYGDFLPIVGTYRAAQRIDKGEPNASYEDLIVNGAMDALGAGMIGSVLKAAGKAGKIHKALKASGFKQVESEPTKFIKTANRTKLSRGYMNPDKYYHINLGPEIIAKKTVPNVDYSGMALQPLIQTLRVPATASFK